MKIKSCFLFALALAVSSLRAADSLPRTWIDPDTGHRVVQLSTEPGTNSLYFTQHAYTAGGTKLIMTTRSGIDLVTVATGEIEHVFEGRVGRVIQTGRKTGAIFYTQNGAVFALDPVTKKSRELAKLPPGGSVVTINSDETLAAGSITEGSEQRGDLAPRRTAPAATPTTTSANPDAVQRGGDNYPDKHAMMDRRLAARLPMTLFTVNLQTGEVKEHLHTNDWINHFQFSPTDPTLLLFAHEGRQWKVDRTWLLRTDGKSQPQLVHQRTMKMEITVHEYWSDDGQWVYYDLQTPLSEDCWVGGYNVTNGSRIWYHVPPNHWSVHYNTSPDGKLFSGDGSDEELHYAKAKDAKWIFLFHPELVPNEEGETPDQAHMIQAARLIPERLVNLGHHDYSLEPNGTFTPDGKWVVFRSNMRGPIHVYAVEVAKAK
ncbi:MAG TPA: oligogalacturonate lyase family protein [Opitutaceae bacterium]|nr:oligogalacturonate lyase family protein [Opitutaceae bacterium]